MEEKQVTFSIFFNNTEITVENINNWFKEMLYFKPTQMRGKYLTSGNTRKFNASKFFSGIEEEIKGDDNFTLRLNTNDHKNLLRVCRSPFYSDLTCIMDNNVYLLVKDKLLDTIDNFFQNYRCLVAHICSSYDDVWQNLYDVECYKRSGKPIDSLHFIEDPRNSNWQIVDIEYNPGHSHYPRDLWFGSCWAMWYGNEYFKYIPKEILASFKDCYESKVLPDGSIRILLHEDVWDYDKPENRERQWAFRRYAGVDEVAHRLENTPMIVENPNPHIELCSGNFEHGGVQVVKYYCDSKGRNVPKSRATECRIREMDGQGNVLWSVTEKL